MRIERSATSLSWIPSDSIPGIMKLPFERGIMHYDPPPPLVLTDLDGMRRHGEFRFANRLGAFIDVEDGRITGWGYSGGKVMGRTPVTAGSLRILLPTKGNQDIQWQPSVVGDEVTFIQTAGGRPGFSFLKPTPRWPFLVSRPFTVWTTIELVIDVRGGSRQRLVGASPFPRHWLYDDGGQLVQKTALTRSRLWARTVFGNHTPWGGEDDAPVVAEPELPIERALSEKIMQRGEPPVIRQLAAGELLFRQGAEDTSVALILDGELEVCVDDHVVGRVGPGTVVGERSSLEAGRRTADLRVVSNVRIAQANAESLDPDLLGELAEGHRREDCT
jgi:hypothetical protein